MDKDRENTKKLVMRFIGILIIWIAVNFGREGVSEIAIFSREWVVCVVLIVAGLVIIRKND